MSDNDIRDSEEMDFVPNDCPNCGSLLTFHTGIGMYVCSSCKAAVEREKPAEEITSSQIGDFIEICDLDPTPAPSRRRHIRRAIASFIRNQPQLAMIGCAMSAGLLAIALTLAACLIAPWAGCREGFSLPPTEVRR